MIKLVKESSALSISQFADDVIKHQEDEKSEDDAAK